jgi:hypothetical protein
VLIEGKFGAKSLNRARGAPGGFGSGFTHLFPPLPFVRPPGQVSCLLDQYWAIYGPNRRALGVFGHPWVCFGYVWVWLDILWTYLDISGHILDIFGHIWDILGHIGSKYVQICPNMSKYVLICPNMSQICPNMSQICPNMSKYVPSIPEYTQTCISGVFGYTRIPKYVYLGIFGCF